MVENNAKGKEARRYFIEMEKKALAASPSAIMLPDFTDPAEAAEAWAQQFRLAKQEQQRANALEVTVEAQKQTIHTKNDLIRASNEASVKAGEILVREFVKSVDIIRDRGIGDKKFYQWMREQGLIMDNRQPYQEYVTRGYFTWKPTSEEINGEYRYTLRITPRGKVWLAAKYMAYLDSASINALHESAERRNGLLLTQGGAA